MAKKYKLISWNVNGIRATLKKGFWGIVEDLQPDIMGIQETKADDSIMSTGVLSHPDYDVHWHSHSLKKGYSGVATLTKNKSIEVKQGFGVEVYDVEGRVVHTEHEHFHLLNIYFPNGGQGPHRVQYKVDFYEECLLYMEQLRKNGKPVIVGGDFNTAHQPIDLHDPDSNHKTSGFMPVERAWLDKISAHGYIDSFRVFHRDEADKYTWWDLKTRSRDRNKGWRIDYFWVSAELEPYLKDAYILNDIMGSDHCPLGLELEI